MSEEIKKRKFFSSSERIKLDKEIETKKEAKLKRKARYLADMQKMVDRFRVKRFLKKNNLENEKAIQAEKLARFEKKQKEDLIQIDSEALRTKISGIKMPWEK